MPPVLNPGENFPIVRVLQDHTDAAINYVQAVIRDATTDAVLATVNLDDKGNRRFQKLWKVLWDNTFANGRWILITTSVYTDSGYTSKNPAYGEVGDTYLVQQRWSQGTYTAVGDGVNWKELRKILKEELGAVEKDEPLPYPQPIDHTEHLTRLVGAIEQVAAKVDAIEIPEIETPELPEPVDLSPVMKKLDAMTKAIEALPKFKETDLTAISGTLEGILSALPAMQSAIVKAIGEAIAKSTQEIVAPITGENARLRTALAAVATADVVQGTKSVHLRRLALKHGLV